jgi:hypothetical protein
MAEWFTEHGVPVIELCGPKAEPTVAATPPEAALF